MECRNLILFFIVMFGPLQLVNSAASDYFHICHRSDPNLTSCITKTFKELIIRLKNGIPELGVPSIDPLHLEEIQFVSGSDKSGVVSNMTNINVYGLTDAIVLNVTAKITKRWFQGRVKVRIPNARIESQYEVNSKILFLQLKGSGIMKINSTDIFMELSFRAERVPRNGAEYFVFGIADGTMEFSNGHVYAEGLFKDPVLNKATNDIINENFNFLLDDIKPSLMKSLLALLADIATKATQKFTVNELLPK